MPTVLHFTKAPVVSASQRASRNLRSARFDRVLCAPKAGAHQVIDNQWNHELWQQSGQHKIPVALSDLFFDEFPLRLSDRNSLILLALTFWHGFRPSLGFCHGFGTVDVPEVRVISPEARTVEILLLEYSFLRSTQILNSGTVTPKLFPHVSVDIARIWPD
jgi:hypothetical protein